MDRNYGTLIESRIRLEYTTIRHCWLYILFVFLLLCSIVIVIYLFNLMLPSIKLFLAVNWKNF